MEKEFVTYDIALKLKNLGFKESCIGTYTENTYMGTVEQKIQYFFQPLDDINNDFVFIAAPLWQQVFDWLRDKHKLDIEFYMHHENGVRMYSFLILELEYQFIHHRVKSTEKFNSFEDARTKSIEVAIDLLKNPDNYNKKLFP